MPGLEMSSYWDEDRSVQMVRWLPHGPFYINLSNGNHSCCAPTQWLSYGVNITLQGTSEHLVVGDQLPGVDSPPCVMTACDKSIMLLWSKWLWDMRLESDATTGVHVMFQWNFNVFYLLLQKPQNKKHYSLEYFIPLFSNDSEAMPSHVRVQLTSDHSAWWIFPHCPLVTPGSRAIVYTDPGNYVTYVTE